MLHFQQEQTVWDKKCFLLFLKVKKKKFTAKYNMMRSMTSENSLEL